MAMPLLLPQYTVDQVRAFPDDGNRYELVEGMLLVTPAPIPRHQLAANRLMFALTSFLGPAAPAYVVGPGEIEIQPSLHMEPDVLVFPSTYSPSSKWTEIKEWWLAVEVLSPSSKYYDRDYKLDAYLRVGVEEVWLVDLDRQSIEVSARDGRRLEPHSGVLHWRPSRQRQPLELDLVEVFRGLT